MITIRQRPYFLRFTRPFGTAHGIREGTDAVFVVLEQDGFQGYGEAALPPYLPDTVATVTGTILCIDLQSFTLPADLDAALDHVSHAAQGHFPAKAAVDMALHDLCGRITGQTTRQLLGLDDGAMPPATFTVGLDDGESPVALPLEAQAFGLLKVKAGGAGDRARIGRIHALAGKPVCVDANGGWTNREEALDMIRFLHAMGAAFVEQPCPPERRADMEWLKPRSPLPLLADESFQTVDDLDAVARGFHGINVKLMKCGGLRPAREIIRQAMDRGMPVLLGCMSESSCGIAAAAQLASLADWTDLDGPLLIANDPFAGIRYESGRLVPPASPGNGETLKPSAGLRF